MQQLERHSLIGLPTCFLCRGIELVAEQPAQLEAYIIALPAGQTRGHIVDVTFDELLSVHLLLR